jgi:DNA replication and repair protein RecF
LYLKNLELSNFRNYKSLKLDLKPGLNIFIGKNAQGKTNLLESIYFLSQGSSYRTSDIKEAVLWTDDLAIIRGGAKNKDKEIFVEVFLPRRGRRKVRLNGSYLNRISDLWGNLVVVIFSPQDLDIVRSSPVFRRQFLDRILNNTNPEYRYHFERYQKILSQRNSLLKLFHKTNDVRKFLSTLDLWNRLLATSGSFIIMERLRLLSILNNFANKIINKFLSTEKLILFYDTSISIKKKNNRKDLEIRMLKKLKERQKRDISVGATTIGPHRDDIKMTLEQKDIRSYGSGGQQRMVAISLKFAELGFYNEKLGQRPILLLDEVLSELDEDKRKALLEISQDEDQAVITSTHYPEWLEDEKSKANVYIVENGKIKAWL